MDERISIVFCFDEKMASPACVAAASLLDAKRPEEHYDIYCVCSGRAKERMPYMRQLTADRDPDSRLTVCDAPVTYDNGYEIRGISKSTYLRLCIHRILPQLDKVIYSDVDVVFRGSLAPLWKANLGSCILGGVKGANNFRDTWDALCGKGYAEELTGLCGQYINAGVLVMDLGAIREWDPDALWTSMAQKQYHYQDQDILNITCKGRIAHLPLCYNVAAHLGRKEFAAYFREGLYSESEVDKAWNDPCILHYTGEKPWDNRGVNKARLWWDYVESQRDLAGLFDKRQVRNRKTTGLLGKINRHLPR